MQEKQIKGFRVNRDQSGEYILLNVEIISPETSIFTNGSIYFRFQSDENREYFYGGQVNVQGRGIDVLKLAAKIMQKFNFNEDLQPKELIQKLQEVHYKPVAYHKGLHEFIERDCWPVNATWQARYIDNTGRRVNIASLTARDEEDARRLFVKKAGASIAKGDMTSYWLNWLKSEDQTVYMTEGPQQFPAMDLRPGKDPEEKKDLQQIA